MPVPKSRLHRLADWLEDEGIDTAQFAFTLIASFSGILLSDEVWNVIPQEWTWLKGVKPYAQVILLLIIILSIPIQVALYRMEKLHSKKISILRQMIDGLEADNAAWAQDLRTLATGYLYNYAMGPLQFGSRSQNTERITLYIHNAKGDFVPVARYSSNAELRTRGRLQYPDDQGCIGHAWRHGQVFRQYPDYHENPEEYVCACCAEGFERNVVAGLRMKSRLIFGHRIDDASGEIPLAVIIVESTDPARYTEAELKSQFGPAEDKYIRRLTERLSPRLPMISEASSVGL